MAQADEQAQADVEPQADVQQPDSDAVNQAPTSTGSDRLDNYLRMYSLTPAQREAAAKRAQANRDAAALAGGEENQVSSFAAPLAAVAPAPGGTPDYFGIYPRGDGGRKTGQGHNSGRCHRDCPGKKQGHSQGRGIPQTGRRALHRRAGRRPAPVHDFFRDIP